VEGETSSFECAHELGKLCENRCLVVNLIPYNQTDVRDKLSCPSEEHIREFQRIVSSYGAFCTIRRTMGADIDSACGQLIVLRNKQKDQKTATPTNIRDIEDGLAGGISLQSQEKITQQTQQEVNQLEQPTSSERISDEKGQEGLDRRGYPGELEYAHWVRPLQIATTIAASCFLLTSALYLNQRKR
jgi:hypothetical protein